MGELKDFDPRRRQAPPAFDEDDFDLDPSQWETENASRMVAAPAAPALAPVEPAAPDRTAASPSDPDAEATTDAPTPTTENEEPPAARSLRREPDVAPTRNPRRILALTAALAIVALAVVVGVVLLGGRHSTPRRNLERSHTPAQSRATTDQAAITVIRRMLRGDQHAIATTTDTVRTAGEKLAREQRRRARRRTHKKPTPRAARGSTQAATPAASANTPESQQPTPTVSSSSPSTSSSTPSEPAPSNSRSGGGSSSQSSGNNPTLVGRGAPSLSGG